MSNYLKMYMLFVTFTALSSFKQISTFSFLLLSPYLCSLIPRKIIYVYYFVSGHSLPFHPRADYVKFTYFFDTPGQNKNQSN